MQIGLPNIVVKAQETAALDEAVDMLDMLILDVAREAKKTGQKKSAVSLPRLHAGTAEISVAHHTLCYGCFSYTEPSATCTSVTEI